MKSVAVSRLRISAVGAAVAFVLAGCSSSEKETARACDALGAFRGTVESATTTLNGSPSARDIRNTGSAVEKALDTLEDALSDSQERKARDLERAVDRFEDRADDVISDSSVAGSIDKLRADLAAVTAAEAAFGQSLGCAA